MQERSWSYSPTPKESIVLRLPCFYFIYICLMHIIMTHIPLMFFLFEHFWLMLCYLCSLRSKKQNNQLSLPPEKWTSPPCKLHLSCGFVCYLHILIMPCSMQFNGVHSEQSCSLHTLIFLFMNYFYRFSSMIISN